MAGLFGREAPCTLEIGFGNGDNLLALAASAPERDFIGVEVHPPGVGHLLRNAGAEGLSNLKVIQHDAVEVLGFFAGLAGEPRQPPAPMPTMPSMRNWPGAMLKSPSRRNC